MAKLNNYTVTPRHNRPGVDGTTYLEFFYIRNGQYTDPYHVSSVLVFKDTNSGDSSNWVDTEGGSITEGLIASADTSSAAMIFSPSSSDRYGADPGAYNLTNFGDTLTTTSGVFRVKEGHYAVALKYNANFSGEYLEGVQQASSLTSGAYWDMWAVQDTASSKAKLYINSFTLFEDNTFVVTEPLLLTTKHKLVQKYINKNSTTRLQIQTEHTVNNRSTPQELKSIFNQSVVDNAAIRIIKLKDDRSSGASYEEVVPWDSNVEINSNDTLSYNWNTTGEEMGMYELQVSSSILDQNVMSDKFNLAIR